MVKRHSTEKRIIKAIANDKIAGRKENKTSSIIV